MPLPLHFLVFSICSVGAERWVPLDSGSEASLRGLCAVDARTCWASGADGTVLLTVDGEVWTRRPVPGGEALDFRDVEAFDAERAVIVSAGAPARVYRTEDGGASWKLAYENTDERAFFDALAFWDDARGLAFSDPIDGKLLVIATEDGGRSWRALPAAALPDSPPGEAGFAASGTCLAVHGANEAWIGLGGTEGARVFRTLDGGGSWHAAPTPMRAGDKSSGIFSLAQLGAGRGVAVGGNYEDADGTRASACVSADGGATWTLAESAPSGYRSCVAVVPRTQGRTLFAVGPNGSDVSSDGGDSWQRFSDEGYHTLSIAADSSVWASGAEGRIARLARPEPAAGSGAAWNQFRGPNGTGIAAGEYPARIGPDAGVVWERAFPEGRSSPVLSAERIFLTGIEDERLFTYAVDRKTGETIWKREAPRPRRTAFHAKNGPAGASAAVDSDTVVVFFDEFGLIAYDHEGTERWRLRLGPFNNVYGMGASPVIVDDVVVLPCDQSTGSFVIAVSKASGRVLWNVERPMAVSGHCTPVVHRTPEGRAQVLLPGSFLLDAYDAVTGKRVWWIDGLPSEMKSVPVLDGDTLWIHGYASPLNDRGNQLEFPPFEAALADMDANGDGALAAGEIPNETIERLFVFFDLKADGVLDGQEWEVLRINLASVNSALAVRVGGEGNMTEQNVLWRSYRSIPQLPSPLVMGGAYYMLADQGGLISILDPATGERKAHDRLADAVDDYYASPVGGDGKVYLLGENGKLTVLAAGGLDVLHSADFEDLCYATPALEDGRIWLRTQTRLYCFGE